MSERPFPPADVWRWVAVTAVGTIVGAVGTWATGVGSAMTPSEKATLTAHVSELQKTAARHEVDLAVLRETFSTIRSELNSLHAKLDRLGAKP